MVKIKVGRPPRASFYRNAHIWTRLALNLALDLTPSTRACDGDVPTDPLPRPPISPRPAESK